MSSPILYYCQSQSPVSLTEKGEQIKKDINADSIFSRLTSSEKGKLLSQIKEKNTYDIQEACIEWAKKRVPECLESKDIVVVKEEAFQNGILLEDIYVIFGIMMRDSILDDLGIPLIKVDEHTPPK